MVSLNCRLDCCPINVPDENINVRLPGGGEVKKISVFVDIHDEQCGGVPHPALVMGVAENVIEAPVIEVHRKHDPAARGTPERFELLEPCFVRAEVLGDPLR